MLANKSKTITIFTAIISLNSSVLMAAEDSASSMLPPFWPLLALAIIVIVFRKQLNCVPTLNLKTKPAESTETSKEVSNKIDLKDDLKQCQASTAKGTRCKRTTSLEERNITIDDKTYTLTVCKQHNTDGLKPFSGLIE